MRTQFYFMCALCLISLLEPAQLEQSPWRPIRTIVQRVYTPPANPRSEELIGISERKNNQDSALRFVETITPPNRVTFNNDDTSLDRNRGFGIGINAMSNPLGGEDRGATSVSSHVGGPQHVHNDELVIPRVDSSNTKMSESLNTNRKYTSTTKPNENIIENENNDKYQHEVERVMVANEKRQIGVNNIQHPNSQTNYQGNDLQFEQMTQVLGETLFYNYDQNKNPINTNHHAKPNAQSFLPHQNTYNFDQNKNAILDIYDQNRNPIVNQVDTYRTSSLAFQHDKYQNQLMENRNPHYDSPIYNSPNRIPNAYRPTNEKFPTANHINAVPEYNTYYSSPNFDQNKNPIIHNKVINNFQDVNKIQPVETPIVYNYDQNRNPISNVKSFQMMNSEPIYKNPSPTSHHQNHPVIRPNKEPPNNIKLDETLFYRTPPTTFQNLNLKPLPISNHVVNDPPFTLASIVGKTLYYEDLAFKDQHF